MQRYCVCGMPIPMDWTLCPECLEVYGDDVEEWPEWLRWLTADIQRELDWDRNHDELPLPDDDTMWLPDDGAFSLPLRIERVWA